MKNTYTLHKKVSFHDSNVQVVMLCDMKFIQSNIPILEMKNKPLKTSIQTRNKTTQEILTSCTYLSVCIF